MSVPRLRLGRSIASQLVIANATMLGATILVMSAIFYVGTVGALGRSIDVKVTATSDRLMRAYGDRPVPDLARAVDRELESGVDKGAEILLVASSAGRPLAGNLSKPPDAATPLGRLVKRQVVLGGAPTSARLLIRRLPGGGLLYVGRDLAEQQAMRRLVWRALRIAAVVALLSSIVGALVFRRQIETRIGEIRRTAGLIEAGNLTSRIRISGDDEFAHLSVDINRMLDRIEHLVEGVRHVSNAVAHDLRTPLMRIRSRLDEALTRDPTVEALSDAAGAAIEGVDDLVIVFDKLLQIAEAESGLRAGSLERLDLNRIVQDMAELYDATAEAQGVMLRVGSRVPVWACGDHDLLASAVASLIDNAIKYAGPGCRVVVFAYPAPEGAIIVVQDNGPGVPAYELPRLAERFYRLDRSRSRSGNGLGLGIVSAIAALHGGKLLLANANPGFQASIVLPATTADALVAPSPDIRPEPLADAPQTAASVPRRGEVRA
jgi:signal transduction histidine kinase